MPTGVYKHKPEDTKGRTMKLKESHKMKKWEFEKGRIPWNKDKKGLQPKSNKTKKLLSKSLRNFYSKNESWIKNAKPEERPSWRGGINIHTAGYIMIYSPNHPYKDSRGYVHQHRLVMEKCLGRYLTPEEVVHHLDFDVTNNKIENLYLFDNNGKHTSYHMFLRDIVKEIAVLKALPIYNFFKKKKGAKLEIEHGNT